MDESRGGLPLVADGVVDASRFPEEGRADAAPTDATTHGALLGLLTLQAAAFALASASGNIPAAVITLFRALLTF